MPSVNLDIVGGTTFGRYTKVSSEATWNQIISDNALVPFPGYQLRANIVDKGRAREIYRSINFNHLFVVIDDGLFTVDDNFGFAKVGIIETSAGDVYIAENDAGEIAIADGVNLYIYNYLTGEPIEKVAVLEGVIRPVYVEFMDGYFIASDGNSNQWYLSNLNQGKIWKVNNEFVIGSLSTKPDTLVATARLDRQLFVIGQKTTEIWLDTGGTRFPFQRSNSLSIDYGCLSASTIAVGFGYLVWISVNEAAGPSLVVTTGGAPIKIATDGIDFLLGRLKNPEDSTAFLFEEDGHIYYQFTFLSDNISLVYDFTTKKFFNISDPCFNYHIARRIAFFNNKHVFVSNNDGGIYELSSDFYTAKNTLDTKDLGDVIPRVRVTKNFRLPDASRYVISRMDFTIDQGYTKQELAMFLRISRDGGYTYGNDVKKTINKIPGRANRMQLYNLGSSNDSVFQFRWYGKDRFVVVGATMDYRQ